MQIFKKKKVLKVFNVTYPVEFQWKVKIKAESAEQAESIAEEIPKTQSVSEYLMQNTVMATILKPSIEEVAEEDE